MDLQQVIDQWKPGPGWRTRIEGTKIRLIDRDGYSILVPTEFLTPAQIMRDLSTAEWTLKESLEKMERVERAAD